MAIFFSMDINSLCAPWASGCAGTQLVWHIMHLAENLEIHEETQSVHSFVAHFCAGLVHHTIATFVVSRHM